MQKILTFAWKQIHTVYSDPSLLLLMFATPLALATIIGLAFGGAGGDLTISDIPIAVVNLDEGDGDTNYGDTIASILLSDNVSVGDDTGTASRCSLLSASPTDGSGTTQQSLSTLLSAERLTDADRARAGVEDGTYAVAVIIPPNFSPSLAPNVDFSDLPDSPDDVTITPVELEIYANGADVLYAEVARSVVTSISNQIVTGTTAISATITTTLENPLNAVRLTLASEDDFADFSCGFLPETSTIQLTRQPLDDIQAESPFVQILVFTGTAQAVFFAIFTINNALMSIYNDKTQGILQRLLVTPTPRMYIIAGKILGSMLLVLIQVGLLLGGLTLIASIVMGEPLFIWGDNYLLLLILTLVVGLSVSGLGVFVIGLASTPEQAQIFGTLVALAMGILGGSFGFSVGDIGQLSIIYWGVDAYAKLSAGNQDITLNLLILLVGGSILFVIGSWLFNRRVDV